MGKVQPITDWRNGFVLAASGAPKACVANLALIARHDRKIRLRYNAWTERAEIVECPPWQSGEWTGPREIGDHDAVGVLQYAEQQHGVSCGLSSVGRVLDFVARENTHDPLRDYLDALTWDRVSRVDSWLSTYMDADDSPVTRAIGRCWLIQCVARALDAGCQADAVVVLEGAQGDYKSSALRALASPDLFSDQIPDIASKDASLALQGVWIVEVAELEAFKGASVNRLKAFVTRRHERYRPPYGQRNVTWGRRCCFAGTTNEREYLSDPTGGRRWWPVRCGFVDVASIERDRDQLWAEAVALYRAGHRWWLVRSDGDVFDALEDRQESRRSITRWEGRIAEYLDANAGIDVTIEDLYRHLEIPMDRSGDRETATRIGRIVAACGWQSEQVASGGRRVRVYRARRTR